jgi:hypothetical protein
LTNKRHSIGGKKEREKERKIYILLVYILILSLIGPDIVVRHYPKKRKVEVARIKSAFPRFELSARILTIVGSVGGKSAVLYCFYQPILILWVVSSGQKQKGGHFLV